MCRRPDTKGIHQRWHRSRRCSILSHSKAKSRWLNQRLLCILVSFCVIGADALDVVLVVRKPFPGLAIRGM